LLGLYKRLRADMDKFRYDSLLPLLSCLVYVSSCSFRFWMLNLFIAHSRLLCRALSTEPASITTNQYPFISHCKRASSLLLCSHSLLTSVAARYFTLLLLKEYSLRRFLNTLYITHALDGGGVECEMSSWWRAKKSPSPFKAKPPPPGKSKTPQPKDDHRTNTKPPTTPASRPDSRNKP
jgi:hypothetical protein